MCIAIVYNGPSEIACSELRETVHENSYLFGSLESCSKLYWVDPFLALLFDVHWHWWQHSGVSTEKMLRTEKTFFSFWAIMTLAPRNRRSKLCEITFLICSAFHKYRNWFSLVVHSSDLHFAPRRVDRTKALGSQILHNSWEWTLNFCVLVFETKSGASLAQLYYVACRPQLYRTKCP